jgi:hypothetical protein
LILPPWRQYIDDILMYIRDFANPCLVPTLDGDPYFPPYRQKDCNNNNNNSNMALLYDDSNVLAVLEVETVVE